MTIIWHNPRCSKSRQALAILEERGITPTMRKYLEDAPSAKEIEDVLEKSGLTALEITRTKEKGYKDAAASGASALDLLARNPKFIERPIVIHGDKAALGRPPEAVLDIL